MLIRCPNCGRPIFYQKSHTRFLDCSYCFSQFPIPEHLEELIPESFDWKKPIYDSLDENTPPVELIPLLRLLRDYKDSSARLPLAKRKQQEIVCRLKDILKKNDGINQIQDALLQLETLENDPATKDLRKELIEKRNQLLRKKTEEILADDPQIYQLNNHIRFLSAYSDDSQIRALIEIVEQQRDRLKLDKIEKEIEEALFSSELDHILTQLNDFEHNDLTDSIRNEAEKKKALLIKNEAEKKERQEELRRKIKRVIISISAAVILAIFIFGLYYQYFGLQITLEKARQYAAEGNYEQAEKQYLFITKNFFFTNKEKQKQTSEEIMDLYKIWSDVLVEQKDWEKAIVVFQNLNDPENEANARKKYINSLTDKNEFEKAHQIDTDNSMSGFINLKEEKFYLEEKEYAKALDLYYRDSSNKDLISDKEIYRRWGLDLAEKGDYDQAVQKLENAEDNEEIREKLKELYFLEGKHAVENWVKKGKKNTKKDVEMLAEIGRKITDIDDQLDYWTILDEHGVDLSVVYPDGAEIKNFSIPAQQESTNTADISRPLVMTREENPYDIALSDALHSTESDPCPKPHDLENSYTYTVKLLPGYWQNLPEERRPQNVNECTCILLGDMRYEYKGTKNDRVYYFSDEKFLQSFVPFSLYAANEKIILWDFSQNRELLIAEKTDLPGRILYTLTSDYHPIYWATQGMKLSANELGFAGNFDLDWLKEKMNDAVEKITNNTNDMVFRGTE